MSLRPSLLYCAGFYIKIRDVGFRFFRRFGLHCATHRIRVILISAVVITSLFYPALALYSSSQPRFIAQISSRLLDSFLVTETLANYHAFHDLQDVWTGYDPLRIREDSIARARCGTDSILRVERVLIHSALPEDKGTLNTQILLSTLKLEQQIGDLISSSHLQCLRKADGTCFVSSPVAFWDYDEIKLSEDTNILDTLQLSTNVIVSNVPITPQMVLAGRESSGTTGSLDFARFLVLTYIFHETDCLGNKGHSSWLDILRQGVERRYTPIPAPQEPRLIALEYMGTTRGYYSVLTTFTFLAYLSLFIYGSVLSRRTDKVHSKIGVVFTGMVELSVSTITSLSVCALAGFKITMVPWEIFPILVVFVGIENMFNLVDAVYKTSVALPVKERIAEGLGRAGTSNTFKLVSYNAILGTLAFFSSGAIRQFCAFAIVVLIAHWSLVHTFFVAVLSIDIQRLELDELLQQGTTITSSVPQNPPPQVQASTRWRKAMLFIRNLLQSRANKNISLLLLLATTGVLYYSTQPSFTRVGDQPLTRGALSRDKPIAVDAETQSPVSHIWKLLNPKDDPLVHVRIETPTILIFSPDITDSQLFTDPKLCHRSRLSVRTFEGLFWVLKIVLVPILATVAMLYPLLLYLLKDAQLLEAQNNRAERDEPALPSFDPPVDDHISFITLPRAFSTDVEMIAASQDGQIVATIGMHDEFIIWRMGTDDRMHVNINVTDMLLRGAGTSAPKSCLTTLALDDGGLLCAVGNRTGVIAIWGIDSEHIKLLHQLFLEELSSGVMDLRFTSSPTRSQVPIPTTSLLATYENGTAIIWTIDGSIEPIRIYPSRSTLSSKCAIVSVPMRKICIVAFFIEDGTLELRNVVSNADPILDFCVPAGNPADLVSLVHACDLEINGVRHTVVGAATKGGVVSVWDGETSECIMIIDDLYGEVNNIRLSATRAKSCSFCGEMMPDAFTITFSIGHIIMVYRAYVFVGAVRKCSCPNNQPQQVPFKTAGVLTKRKLGGGRSASPSGTSSPHHIRSRHPSLSNGNISTTAPSFPISGHGVHSRRTSEKDMLRRAVESMVLPVPAFDNEELEKAPPRPFGSLLGVPATVASLSLTGRSPLWENVVVVRAADATFERGKWDLVNDKIVGLRRRPRAPLKDRSSTAAWKVQLRPETSSGLSSASLERWELWVLDPWVARIQASSLAKLQRDQGTTPIPGDQIKDGRRSYLQNDTLSSIPRLPFTRVTPFVCVPSYCFAGFGNTVGLFELAASSPLGGKT